MFPLARLAQERETGSWTFEVVAKHGVRVFGEPALGAKDCGEVLLPGKRFGVREILKPAGSAIVFLRLADRTAAAWVARELSLIHI